MSMETPPFAALLLAGGRSRRMGYDKAFLEWNGVPMWRWQLEKLAASRASRLLLSCRSEQAPSMADLPPDAEFIWDLPDHSTGPLGILTHVLELMEIPVLALAVDMPWLPVAEVVRRWSENPATGFCFEAGHGVEPLAAVYVPALLPLLSANLAAGRLSLQPMIHEAAKAGCMAILKADESEHYWFKNLNTPEEYGYEKGGLFGPP